MKRVMLIAAVASLLTMSAFAQVNPGTAETSEGQEVVQTQRIQQQITELYIADFKNEVQLTDDQFLKLSPGIRNFMRLQFENARRRQALRQQLSQLMEQPNPSESDVTQLIDARKQIDAEAATMETRFLTRIGAELSPSQKVRVMDFNRKFMDEKLPGLIQRARERAVNNNPALRDNPARNRNAQQPPVVRPNANRPNGQARPGAALKGRNK